MIVYLLHFLKLLGTLYQILGNYFTILMNVLLMNLNQLRAEKIIYTFCISTRQNVKRHFNITPVRSSVRISIHCLSGYILLQIRIYNFIILLHVHSTKTVLFILPQATKLTFSKFTSFYNKNLDKTVMCGVTMQYFITLF